MRARGIESVKFVRFPIVWAFLGKPCACRIRAYGFSIERGKIRISWVLYDEYFFGTRFVWNWVGGGVPNRERFLEFRVLHGELLKKYYESDRVVSVSRGKT